MQLCWFLFTFYAQNDLLYFWCIIHLIQFISIHFNSFLFKLLLSTIVVYLVDLDQFFSFNFQKYKLLSSYICQIYTVLGAKFTQIDIITILKLTLRFRTPCTIRSTRSILYKKPSIRNAKWTSPNSVSCKEQTSPFSLETSQFFET